MSSKFSNLKISYKIYFFILFFFLLTLHHLFPIILVGSPIIYIRDILNCFVPNNYIAGKILVGNLDSAKLFLNGELPWHFVYGIFFPINFIYSFLDIDKAYIFTDLIIRLIGFFSFLYFLKRFQANLILKVLISCLFSSQLITTSWGLGVASFPYVFAICFRDKKVKIKHLITLAFIASNTDLYLHGIYVYVTIFISALFLKDKIFFFNKINLIKIFCIYSLFLLISNSNLFYNLINFSPFQLTERLVVLSLKENFLNFFKGIFIPEKVNSYFLPNFFLIFLLLVSIIFSFFKKIKINFSIFKILIFLQLIILVLSLPDNFEIFNELKKYTEGALFTRLSYFVIFFQILILFNFNKHLNINKIFLSFVIILAIIYNQISPSLFTVIKSKSEFSRFSQQEKKIIKENYENLEISKFIENYTKFANDKNKNFEEKDKDIYVRSHYASSFEGYYRKGDFKIIKNYVGEKRTFSIGFDPFVSVVNDIKVTGGYYRYYPLAYKYKFFEIIKDQIKYLEGEKLIKDAQLLYSFYKEGDEIRINFNKLKNMNVKFVISKFTLKHSNLDIVCEKCNNASDLNLYQIN